MLKQFYKKHRKTISKFEGLLVNNTVLERGLVIAPVIIAATTLQNALILGISFLTITFLTLLAASFVPKKLPYSIRVIIYTIVACLLYIPTEGIMDHIFPEAIFKVGIFLPLLVTNSLIVTKSETRFLKQNRTSMMLDVLSHALGFLLVIILVGTVREIFGNGSVMGHALNLPVKITVLTFPFGGFVLVGFLAALVQRFRLYLEEPDKNKRHSSDKE